VLLLVCRGDEARAAGTERLRPGCRFDVVLADDVWLVLAAEAKRPLSEYLQTVNRLWSLARRYWFDLVIMAGLAFGITVVVADQGKTDGPNGPLWLDVLLVAGIIAPLFARRRFSFGALAAVPAAVVVSAFLDDHLLPDLFAGFLAGCAAVFLMAQLRDRRQAVAGLAMVCAAEVVVASTDPTTGIGDFVFALLFFAAVWVVGFTLGRKFEEADAARERATLLELEREERARAAVADERARIARELHDVVGHSVSVMTVQASGVRRLLRPEQEREREALLIVERTGREALAEMRRMVGVLRRPEEGPALAPQPSLEHVNRLVDQAREAGLPVELRIEGDAIQLPAGLDLTAYRLVQEGLTNALKHADASRAEVLVNYGDGHLEVTVSDDGRGVGNGDGGGHGLVGMRERVSVYGGELDAGPRPGGGYELRAKLPLAP
jgi:signal transduction histidine kinase